MKFLKRFIMTVLLLVPALIILSLISIRIPAVNHFVTGKISSIIKDKMGAYVTIDKFSIGFSPVLEVHKVSLRGPDKKEIAVFEDLSLDIKFLPLFHKQLHVEQIYLSGGKFILERQSRDAGFNIDFLTSGNDTTTKDTSASWVIRLDQMTLDRAAFRMLDIPGGLNMGYTVQHLNIAMDTLDLEKLKFHASSIVVNKADGFFHSMKSDGVIDSSGSTGSSPMPDIACKKLRMTTSSFAFSDSLGGISLTSSLQDLDAIPTQLDLETQHMNARTLAITGASVVLHLWDAPEQTTFSTTQMEQASSADTTSGFRYTAQKLSLINSYFKMDLPGGPAPDGFDASHMELKKIQTEIENAYVTMDSMSANIRSIAAIEHDALEVKHVSGWMAYHEHGLDARNMIVKTSRSEFSQTAVVRYNSIDDLAGHPRNVRLEQFTIKGHVSMTDVGYFAPMPIRQKDMNVFVNTDLQGSVDQLAVNRLELQAGESIHLLLQGRAEKILDSTEVKADLTHVEVTMDVPTFRQQISDTLLPKELIITQFSLAGKFKGGMQGAVADATIVTNAGDVAIEHITIDSTANVAEQISINNVNPAMMWRGLEKFGPVRSNIQVVHHGRDLLHGNWHLLADVPEFRFMNYAYKRMSLEALADSQNVQVSFNARDSNLVAHVKAALRLDSMILVTSAMVGGVDLNALHFTDDPLKLSTSLTTSLQISSWPVGKLAVHNTRVETSAGRMVIDSVIVNSENNDGVKKVTVKSDYLDGHLSGRFDPQYIVAAIEESIGKNVGIAFNNKPVPSQQLDLDLNFNHGGKSAFLFRNLKHLSPFSITGHLDSDKHEFNLDAHVPGVHYEDYKLDTFDIRLNSDADKSDLKLTFRNFSGAGLKLENMQMTADSKAGETHAAMSVDKAGGKNVLKLGIDLHKKENWVMHVDSGFWLNGDRWQVAEQNSIEFGSGPPQISHLVLAGAGQTVSANSVNRTMQIGFRQFQLTNLSRIVEQQEGLVSGNITGSVSIDLSQKKPLFDANLKIGALSIQQKPVGNIDVKASSTGSEYRVNLSMAGDNRLNTVLNINPSSGSINGNLQIDQLALSAIEPFTAGNLSRSEGSLSGKINIAGKLTAPKLTGDLSFHDIAFTSSYLQTRLRIPASTLQFNQETVKLNGFKLMDSLGHTATLDGTAQITGKMPFNLRLRTTQFLALNTTKLDNPLYHGRVLLDSDLKLTGNPSSPSISGRIRLDRGTMVTYERPVSALEVTRTDGVVEFADTVVTGQDIMQRNDTASVSFKGIDLHCMLSFDKNVKLKMVLDPVSKDSLFVVGTGNLDLALTREGNTTLTGSYRIDDGGYFMTISKVVHRNFAIEKGSTVSWSGDPLEAYLDVKAVYKIKASPLDLMQEDLAGVSEMERNRYRNLLDFIVYLNMNGMLSAPLISFDIQLAPQDKGALNGSVNTKLAQISQDETRLNKQVFALLTLKRFVGDNPLQSSSESGISATSRTSASNLLTSQLNALSGRYVNFVDLDLGVNSFEDYSTGREEGRTQLQVGVSKQLFNDRVSVHVGGNVELEGERARQNNANDIAGNISIDYNLTDDGRYKARAFRLNQYENPIEGELTRTGAGIIYTRNFNKLMDLFRKPRVRNNNTNAK